jgi:hypothetical protein
MRPAGYAAAGVGVAGLVTFTVFGLMARSTYDDLNGACHGGPCASGKADQISTGKTQQTAANVGLALGIAGAVAGATFLVVSWSRGSHASSALIVSPLGIGFRGAL